jgi:hypothetical protein
MEGKVVEVFISVNDFDRRLMLGQCLKLKKPVLRGEDSHIRKFIIAKAALHDK